jgi:hypothetical protein
MLNTFTSSRIKTPVEDHNGITTSAQSVQSALIFATGIPPDRLIFRRTTAPEGQIPGTPIVAMMNIAIPHNAQLKNRIIKVKGTAKNVDIGNRSEKKQSVSQQSHGHNSIQMPALSSKAVIRRKKHHMRITEGVGNSHALIVDNSHALIPLTGESSTEADHVCPATRIVIMPLSTRATMSILSQTIHNVHMNISIDV